MVIDTGIFIEHLRARDKSPTSLFKIQQTGVPLFVSTITVFELFAGATDPAKWEETEHVLSGVAFLPFLEAEAKKAAKIFQHLRSTGQIIEFRDIFIAATALFHGYPIKTSNVRHFNRIPELALV